LRGINPDLVLVIYNPYSMQGFTDQLIREARKRNIKSVGIQMNWDNIANRCMFVRPDALGVIGWQSFMHARLYQNFPVEELQVLGNSYFSGYKLVQPITRSDLKSPQSGTPITIGIGPTNREHDEMFVLEEVLRSIKTGELPQTTRVILKPYGRSWQHYVDTFMKAGYKVQGITEFENFTFLAPPTNSNQTSDKTITQFEQVQDFFSKIDILVTPYSSLAVEAMLSKIPLVLLDYDPKQYGISHRHKWEVLLKGPHLEPLRINQSPIKCVSRNQLVDCITDALAKTQKNSIESNFKLASFLIEQPESSYADGLVKWLKSFN
jgi:hypothetical protein